MTRWRQNLTLSLTRNPLAAAAASTIMFVLTVAATPAAQAQTYTVLHHFTGAQDGANPEDGLSIDGAGRLYGVTANGGFQQGSCAASHGCGTVFRMTPSGSGWLFSPLYSFTSNPDGANPYGRVIIGPDGALYGTTEKGGEGGGTVFRLAPSPTAPKNALAPWSESVLHAFNGSDGAFLIDAGGLAFNAAGNLYGTTYFGGGSDVGTVFELTPSNGAWTEKVLYSFRNDGLDGKNPSAGVILDPAGSVYGDNNLDGCQSGCEGTVFQLTPSSSGWTENILYSFNPNGSEGAEPEGGLIMDNAGNLYGSTVGGADGATVFQLAPSNGSWTISVLAYVAGGLGLGPFSSLLLDDAGNLYGTTYSGGVFGAGNVFKVTHTGNTWTLSTLHDFDGNDGSNPYCNLVRDANGNLYGTTYAGGRHNLGVVFEITP